MPCSAHSAAIAWVSILMPPLATVYGATVARASWLVGEPMLITLPRPRGIIRLAASRPTMKALVRRPVRSNRAVDISGLRTANGQVGALEHRSLQLRPEPRPLHR